MTRARAAQALKPLLECGKYEASHYCPNCGQKMMLDRFLDALEAAGLFGPANDCAPFLKDDETPAECIERHRKDIDALLTVLAQAKRHIEPRGPVSEDARLIEQLCRDLNEAHNEILKLQGVTPEDYGTYDWPEWSGPANSLRWAGRRLGKSVGKTPITAPDAAHPPTAPVAREETPGKMEQK
jgi:hypothetical protein